MRTESFGATDTGKRRKNNEDAFLVNDRQGLYAVADGVGGNEGGEVASRIAVETLAACTDAGGGGDRTPAMGVPSAADAGASLLRSAFDLANRNILIERGARPGLSQMGTTLTALFVSKGRACIGHIGDSRAYLLRSGRLKQITDDHSIVGEQLRAGVLKPAQARSSPHRHVITRALGIANDLNGDFSGHDLRRNDTVLLCTDGLTEMVDDGAIQKVLTGHAPREAAQKLIIAANERGGVDNITVVVVRVVG